MSASGTPASVAALDALIDLIRTLRSPAGCPWDRQQTPQSIATYLVEEVYELVDAVDRGKPDQVLEELGDVLFQVLFVAELYAEKQHFEVGEVIAKNVEKMRRRHPHVFGEARDLSTEQIRRRWHEIKEQEKEAHPEASALDSVPRQLPPLMRAYRICERAAHSGLERIGLAALLPDLETCGRRLQQAVSAGQNERAAPLLGELLFAAAQTARIARIHPDTVLKREVDQFERRFRALETAAAAEGKTLTSLTKPELRRLWATVIAAEVGT